MRSVLSVVKRLIPVCALLALLTSASVALGAGPLTLRLVDAGTNEPITNLKVNARQNNTSANLVTDQAGVCRIEVLPGTNYLRAETVGGGYVPTGVSWNTSQGGSSFPSEFTMRLERGTPIGGVVKDETGHPVPGATVFMALGGGEPRPGQQRHAVRDVKRVTDSNGRWRWNEAPSDLKGLMIRLAHPAYQSDRFYGERSPAPSAKALLAMESVMVMKRGLIIEGRVRDPGGMAIEGATVTIGDERFASNIPTTTTDADGRFFIEGGKPGTAVLTVIARGWAPDLQRVRVGEETGPVEFSLEPGKTIRLRVVDLQGAPIKGAGVSVDSWRGSRSLDVMKTNRDLPKQDPKRVKRTANAQGIWVWDSAPADEVLIDVYARGLMRVREKPIVARDEDWVITMTDALTVSGRVIDAETKQAVKAFNVLSGIAWEGSETASSFREGKPGASGSYSREFTYPYPGHVVRIEAEGYLPADSRVFRSDEGAVTYDFELKKGAGVEGRVLRADGSPVEGATVVLYTSQAAAYIRPGLDTRSGNAPKRTTDDQGAFSFSAQTMPFALIVLHEDGVANGDGMEFPVNGELVLEEWGRIEGRAIVSRESTWGGGVGVSIDDSYKPDKPRIHFDYRTTVDSDGNFTIENILPGERAVYREIKLSDNMTRHSHRQPVTVVAGETTFIEMGGTGRPVIGRIAIPDEHKAALVWARGDGSMNSRPAPNPIGGLMKLLGGTPPAQLSVRRNYGLKIETDGAFRVDDVEAGEYGLSIRIYGPQEEPSSREPTIGQAQLSITVPDGALDEPFDMGEVTIAPVPQRTRPPR